MRDYSFGNFISALRVRRGLSQYQLGALVGVSDKAVSKWENGVSKPRMNIIVKLAEVLDIGTDELLACKYDTLIQSVDNLKLAHEISRLAVKNNKTMNVLVEINIGDEATKSGVSAEMAEELVRQTAQLPNVSVKGLMAIPPVGSGEDVFEKMHGIFLSVKEKDIPNVSMDVLSMGMSGDYELAIKHGSNLVRIGTKLFGARKYLED